MCKKTLIANIGDIQVTRCCNCKMINIWKTGLLLSFSYQQFYQFARVTKRLDFGRHFEYSPDGNRVVILSTPSPDICLKFTHAELQDFKHIIAEALYMHEIYEMVYG